jgi:hypothetical protein
VAVAAGGTASAGHSLALAADGTVWAWGDNAHGQIGNGTRNGSQTTPVQVSGLGGVAAIAAGGASSYALDDDGDVWAWGDNEHRQLGTNGRRSTTPNQVPIDDVVGIAAGGAHALAVTTDGTAWAWGLNDAGQLGAAGAGGSSRDPVAVDDLDRAQVVGAGDAHSLSAVADGTAWAWGANVDGQLGDGSADDAASPVQVLDVERVLPLWDRELEVDIDGPADGAEIDASDGWFEMHGTATGSDEALAEAWLLSDGEVIFAEPLWDAHASEWSITVVPPEPGDYELEVVVADEAGRQGSATIDVTIEAVLDIDPEEGAVLAPKVQVLEGDLLDALAPVDYPATELRFAADSVPFVPGDVLVADVSDATPDGLLVRVRGVEQDGDEWVVRVEQASLADVFLHADFEVEGGDPDGSEGILEFHAQSDPTIRECESWNFDENHTLFDHGGSGSSATLKVSNSHLQACLEATFRLQVDVNLWSWNPSGEVEYFEASAGADGDTSFDVSLDGKAGSFKHEFPSQPRSRRLPPLRFGVPAGPIVIPVVITNELKFQMEASGGADASFSTTISGAVGFNTGLYYSASSGWSDSAETYMDFDYGVPEFSGVQFDARIGPKIMVDSKLYGVVGPRFQVYPALRGQVTAFDDDVPHFRASLITSFDISAQFPKQLGDAAPDWSHQFGEPERILWEAWLGEAGGCADNELREGETRRLSSSDDGTVRICPGEKEGFSVRVSNASSLLLHSRLWDSEGNSVDTNGGNGWLIANEDLDPDGYTLELNNGEGDFTLHRYDHIYTDLEATLEGGTATYELEVPGQLSFADVELEAGQMISLVGSGPRGYIWLTDPDGEDVGRSDTYRDHLAMTVEQTGTYRMRHETMLNGTGNGSMTIWDRPEDPEGTVTLTHGGDELAQDLPVVGMKAHATFQGSAGDLITLMGHGPRGFVYLYGPDGEEIGRTDTYRDMLTVELEASGTYAITYDPTIMNGTGEATIQLWQRYPDPEVTFVPSAGGHQVTFDMPIIGMRGHGTFTGSAGAPIRIEAFYTDGTRGIVELYDPDGQRVAWADSYRGAEIEVTLEKSGTYRVTYDPTILFNTGQATVTVYDRHE